jgi:hypothetical protein
MLKSMKLKQLSAFSMLLLIGIIISSCATNHAVEKLLVGKWNPVTVENLTPNSYQPGATETVKVDTSTEEGTHKEVNLTLPTNPTGKNAKIERFMSTEMRSPITLSIINKQKTVEKFIPGKTAKGTWKLTKRGKRIVIKESETGKSYTVDIVSLSDTATVFIERLPFGDLKVKYAKQK